MWPDELEELVYVFVRIELVKRRRQRAAACLTRHVRARLTRRWFVMRARPWLWQGRALLWPHPVAMHLSWDDESGASGFEDIRPVRETAIPVAAYARRIGASRRDVSRHDAANGFANVCGIRVKKVPPSYYLLMYMLK